MPSSNLLEYEMSHPSTDPTTRSSTLDVTDEAFDHQSIMSRGTASPGLKGILRTSGYVDEHEEDEEGQGHVYDESYTKQRQESDANLFKTPSHLQAAATSRIITKI
ncbi:hypothetical protein GYMLUDRAFT_248277 [Collybiopsis luxurians FD-317 M1]|uniref:Uncharacterized protein n=1 Tax=Collybiopsis luxurians FD-317 M1 TaxID=944289 RepID=A0A0D0CCT3_9AGAR|nr:hypothetical protein GYMLUDRAFT_248277 [Collybiopsis luxurians FD-317 M1]